MSEDTHQEFIDNPDEEPFEENEQEVWEESETDYSVEHEKVSDFEMIWWCANQSA